MAIFRQDGLDPTGATTPQAFMQLLRQARNETGLSIVEIVERARERGYDLDAVNLSRTLAAPTLPAWQVVTGVLSACGMGGMQIDRWMRVYHDLATPTHVAASVTAVMKQIVVQPIDVQPIDVQPADLLAGDAQPDDVEPTGVLPLMFTDEPAKPTRFARRNVAVAAGALAALVMLPLLLFVLFNGEPGTVAAEATSPAPRTDVLVPMPSPYDEPTEQPSPADTASATPSVTATTAKASPRISASPSPSPSRPPSPRPSPSPSPSPAVLRSGSLSLTGSQSVDLDSGQTGSQHDIYRLSGTALSRVSNSGAALEPMSSMPSKQSCQAVQSWDTWVGNLGVGQWLCVRTSEGRMGRINITAVGTTLKLSYTVWA